MQRSVSGQSGRARTYRICKSWSAFTLAKVTQHLLTVLPTIQLNFSSLCLRNGRRLLVFIRSSLTQVASLAFRIFNYAPYLVAASRRVVR
jgi:hypothetical protein